MYCLPRKLVLPLKSHPQSFVRRPKKRRASSTVGAGARAYKYTLDGDEEREKDRKRIQKARQCYQFGA